MKTTNPAHITINLDDVRRVDGQTVRGAILAWASKSNDTSSGAESVESAVESGALYYVEENSGRMIGAKTAVKIGDEWPSDVIHEMGGDHVRLGEWSKNSVVCVACPDIEDAMEYPTIVAAMAQSVINHHGPCSDRAAWKNLITLMQQAAEEVENIDLSDFDV